MSCSAEPARNRCLACLEDRPEDCTADAEASTTFPAMPIEPDTLKALRTAGRKVTEWTAERDRLVRQAVAEGGSLRAVGDAAGLSHTAVSFIVSGRRK